MTNGNTYQIQVEQDRFAMRLASRLSEATEDLPYDISERLRASRVRAVSNRKVIATQQLIASSIYTASGSAAMGGEHLNWWDRLATTIPLVILISGLIMISAVQNDRRANDLAEIDVALLLDDLPPSAYTDSGFAQFLKVNSETNK